jgi:hypothetical protein
MTARKPQQLRAHRRGAIEMDTLVIWIILFVFLILILAFLFMLRSNGEGQLGGLCANTGGLVGC